MAIQDYTQWQPLPSNDAQAYQQYQPPPYQQYEPYQTQSTRPKPQSQFQTKETSAADERAAKRKQSFKQRYLGGIRITLRAFALAACVILAVNLYWLAYAKSKYGIKDGYGIIEKGNCDSVKSTNTWLHLGINIMSTLLLTGSNAFMAAFSSPSRKEVDMAHSRGRSLHIGSLSFRNLVSIAKRKSLIVLALLLSSAPFHLMYNSLVFTSISANEYYWNVVTEDFLTGAPFNWTESVLSTTTPFNSRWGNSYKLIYSNKNNLTNSMNEYFDNLQKSASSWERLENQQCIEAYSNVFVSTRRNVVLVSSTKSDTNSLLMAGSADFDTGSDLDYNWWICSEKGQDGGSMVCNPEDYVSKAASWSVFDYPIEYCLSEKVDSICEVQFSLTIMYVVVAFNCVKVAAMLFILFRVDAEKLLTSVGDAASSFLKFEDQTTMGMCLANKRQISSFWRSRGFARPFTNMPRRWGQAVSRRRWFFFFLLMCFGYCLVAFFGIWGFVHVKDQGVSLSLPSLWKLGFGTINQHAMVFVGTGGGTPVEMAILANIAQAVLAWIYLMYMGIMTVMFLAADWNTFGFKPQYLMVSTPVGKQRGTWLLGAPIIWGISLVGLQVLLHWFVSESIFMVQVTVFNKDGTLNTDIPVFSNCGYSPIAIILSVITAGILVLTSIILMLRKFPKGAPPIVATNSAAISASCHPMIKNEDIVYDELRWGVSGTFPNGVGHCSLVQNDIWESGKAFPPSVGWTYS